MARYESIPIEVNAERMNSRLDLIIAKAFVRFRGCSIHDEFTWIDDHEKTKKYEHLLYIKFSDPISNKWWILFNGHWLVDTPNGFEVLNDKDFHQKYRELDNAKADI